MTAGDEKMSQQCHKYLFQYSTLLPKDLTDVQIFENKQHVNIFLLSIANLKCTPSDRKMHSQGYKYPRLGIPVPEMITIRFACLISGRIVSLQPDTDIQKLPKRKGTGYGYPKRFFRYFDDSDFWKKLHIAQS